ncbi:hypothetical protein A1O3_01387, partial [Capronia epimyces CBS 606.96]
MRYGAAQVSQLLRPSHGFSRVPLKGTTLRLSSPFLGRIGHTHFPKLCAHYSTRRHDETSPPVTQLPESQPAARPTLPARQWSTPLAKTIAQAIE